MGIKQKKIKKIAKKISKWPTQKNWVFQPPPKAEQLPPKFHGLVLGLVELIDAKGIGLAQPIWPWDCPTWAQKRPKNTKNAYFACFRAYVGQPHGHIGWATSLPFASINPTNPRTDPWNFHKKILRIGGVEKLSFFESAILNFFFDFWFFFFFCFIPMKISHKLCVRMDGTQFLLLWWFTAKNEGGNHIIAWVYLIIKTN